MKAVLCALLLVACSNDTIKPAQTAQAAKAPPVDIVEKTAAPEAKKDDGPRTAQAVSNMLGLDAEIVRMCNLHFDVAPSEEGAPRFDTDESELSAQDAAILAQVATCLTSGPLAGRNVRLVGRADSRGASEYNMVLGENRANKVGHYLQEKGVETPRINETSRGELDAIGTDDTTMRNDRRVDVMLGS